MICGRAVGVAVGARGGGGWIDEIGVVNADGLVAGGFHWEKVGLR